jgi:hypothetical protein
MKQSEKERLINNAYKQKVENLKFNLFSFAYLPISKGFIPFGVEYNKLKFTKYFSTQLIFMNLILIINLKIFKNAKD